MTDPSTAASIPQRILANSERLGGRDAFVFLERGEAVSATLSYESLAVEVARGAGRMTAEGLSREPVLVALPAGISFVTVFLACLWTRAIAIPVPYPANARALERLRSVLADARPFAIVTDAGTAARLAAAEWEVGAPRVLIAADLMDGAALPISPLNGTPDDLALIQYTSGSTHTPRGIAITQENLLANQKMIASAFREDESVVGVSWLPHFHDMGLLGGILQSLFLGGTSVLMDPFAFVQKPIRWLRAISRFRGTTAGGPCFAYDLCARQCAEADIAELDLSSWRVAFCGAEPVRQPVLDRFASRLAPARFDRRSFLPCYGLAEATLIASCAVPGQGSRELAVAGGARAEQGSERHAVSCGPAVEGCTILVRGEDGQAVPEGAAGEVWVAGAHVSPGTWDGQNRRVAPYSEAYLNADGQRFVPTGDVGAFVGGELVPIDRIKDILIVYGRKLHASDIEATLLAHPLAVDLLAACAFAVDVDEGSHMVVLCEMERQGYRSGKAGELAPKLPPLIAESFGILPRLKIVPHGSLPRTTSGKIQRRQCKLAYASGALGAAAAPEFR